MTVQINGDTGVSLVQDNTIQTADIVNGAVTADKLASSVTGTAAPQKMMLTAAKAAVSGTSIDFSPADGTGIPGWAKKITVMFNGVSTNGTSLTLIQLGTSSGFETTGYIGNAGVVSGINSTGIASSGSGIVSAFSAAASNRLGTITFTMHSGTTWLVSGLETADTLSTSVVMISGRKTLSGTLDRLRLTTMNGTDTFDAGSVSLLIEG